MLQFNLEMRVVDWFLYKEYRVIRIHGFEEEPYRIQVFLKPRVLAMEYVREIFTYDDMDFVHFN